MCLLFSCSYLSFSHSLSFLLYFIQSLNNHFVSYLHQENGNLQKSLLQSPNGLPTHRCLCPGLSLSVSSYMKYPGPQPQSTPPPTHSTGTNCRPSHYSEHHSAILPSPLQHHCPSKHLGTFVRIYKVILCLLKLVIWKLAYICFILNLTLNFIVNMKFTILTIFKCMMR